jgi:hypothetical protein
MIEIKDPDKYDKAVGLLVRLWGTFHTRPTQKLIVSRDQLEALVDQGLVTSNKLAASNGGKKAKASKS